MNQLRRCVACRRCGAKQEFVRIVRLKDGSVVVAGDSRVHGRSVYFCRTAECMNKAKKKGTASRLLKAQIASWAWDEVELLVQ